MSRLHGILHRLRVLMRGERYAREQAREVAFHLELEAMAQRAEDDGRGLDAELRARRAFGNVTYYREEVRGMSALGLLDRLRQDVRYALRGLRRQPGFTAMVVVTLALGFGVNAAMFSLLNRLFLHQPDGVVRPEEVRRFYNTEHQSRTLSGERTVVFDRYEYPHYRAALSAGLGSALALTTEPDSITIRERNRAFSGHQSEIDGPYFAILGLRPEAGRFFVDAELAIETPAPVAVISDFLWRTRFDRRQDIVGSLVTIDRRPFTIIGVAPPEFRGIDLGATDLWVPLNTRAYTRSAPTPWYEGFGVSARMIGRVDSPATEARIVNIVQRAMRFTQIPHYGRDSNTVVSTGSLVAARGPSSLSDETRVLTHICVVALFVLAIAVANVVNLLLLRSASRQREIAVRRALGVSMPRLIAQLTIESTLLASIAGGVAVTVSLWAGALLRRLVMPEVHWGSSPLDASTSLFILCLSLLIGVASGLAPALHGGQIDANEALRSNHAHVGRHQSSTRSVLVAIQAAFCVVLLVGAGLFVKSLFNVESIDTGYDIEDIVTAAPIFLPNTGSHSADAVRLMPDIIRRVAANPAVAVASYAQITPMRGMQYTALFLPGRDTLPALAGDFGPSLNTVSSTFFDAAGMRMLRGRNFSSSDTPTSPRVMVVNATMAATLWPNADPIGACVHLHDRASPCTTVVGVVSDAHRYSLIENRSMTFFIPVTQPLDTVTWITTLVVRARPGQARLAQVAAVRAIEGAFSGLDGVYARSLYSVVEREARPWQIGATLFTAFGILAFIVAGVGVYSVVAYAVAQRTHELGIRIALGATRTQIVDLVVGNGIRAVGMGVAIGLAASWLLAPLVRSLLFGVTTDDSATYIGAATALCLLGTLASLAPALRAARVDPVVALRSD